MFKLTLSVFNQPGIGWTAQVVLTTFEPPQEHVQNFHGSTRGEATKAAMQWVTDKVEN